MNEFQFRLALFVLVMITFCFPIISTTSVEASTSGSPSLKGGRITPENGRWGSVFTYEVTYKDNENNFPEAGYPKVYIDGGPENMVEKDPTDNDVTDGKVYKFDWTTTRENIGSHTFYYFVRTPAGENARDPPSGAHVGPTVEKVRVLLRCRVDNPAPAPGETVTFSGRLKTEENLGIKGENITLYELLVDDNVRVGSTTTDENGNFSFTLGDLYPGILCYVVRFYGENYCDPENSQSPRVYVNTLDKSFVFGGWAVILFFLVGLLMFFFSRGVAREHYLKPVLVGFALGFLLVVLQAADFGILAGGAITGYLFAKSTRKWTTHMRIGCMTGFLFVLLVGLVVGYLLTEAPELFGPAYSIPQMDVFKILLVNVFYSYLVYFSLLTALGAALGGFLRRFLVPTQERAQPPGTNPET